MDCWPDVYTVIPVAVMRSDHQIGRFSLTNIGSDYMGTVWDVSSFEKTGLAIRKYTLAVIGQVHSKYEKYSRSHRLK